MGLRSYISIACGLISTMAVVICLSMSSFFEMYFGGHNSTSSGTMLLVALLVLLVLLLFISPHLNAMLMKVYHFHFFPQACIHFIFLSVPCAVGFVLMRLQNSDIHHHSTQKKSCNIEQGNGKTTLETQYSLYSLGGFDVLALIVSLERGVTVELGFFSILLQLSMEISLEINVWFTLVTALFSVAMISARRRNVSIANDRIRTSLKVFSTVVGVVFLYLCSFTRKQFEDAELKKGVFFIIFGISLVLIIPRAPNCMDKLVEATQKHFLLKTLVGSLMLLFVSVLMFLNKYPGFRTTFVVSCVTEEANMESHGNLYDLLCAGALSVYSLIISSRKQQPMELGIFSFSLEMTMCICVEVSGKNPGLWFLFSYAFCVGLILIRSYLGSLAETAEIPNNDIESGRGSTASITDEAPDISTFSNEHATSSNGSSSENSKEPIQMESVAVVEHTDN